MGSSSLPQWMLLGRRLGASMVYKCAKDRNVVSELSCPAVSPLLNLNICKNLQPQARDKTEEHFGFLGYKIHILFGSSKNDLNDFC